MKPQLHILLVEDNLGDAEFIQEILTETRLAAFTFTHAEKLAEALSYLKAHGVSLALLDLGLPDSMGIETVYRVREAAPQIPIVVLTGQDDETTGIAAVKAGAQDYLVKGKVSGELLERIFVYAVERHQHQVILNESEQFLRSSLDALSAHIAITDPDGTIATVNNAWRTFARENDGDRNDGFIGTNYLKTCDQAAAEGDLVALDFAKRLRAVLEGAEDHFELEYPCHSPDQHRWFHAWVSAFPTPAPRPVVIAHENITRRKEAEQALQASEQQLRMVLDASPNCVFITDQHARFILVNEALADLYGIEKSAMIGKTEKALSSEVKAGWDRQAFTLGEAYSHDGPTRRMTGFDALFTLPDGMKRRFRVILTPITLPEMPDCMLGIAVDMTDQHRAQEKLRQAQKMESLGTLAGGIAHDFNNILSAILGFTELAVARTTDPDLKIDLKEVYQAGVRAKDLVRQILTFSRRTDTALKPLDVRDVIREALKLLRSTLPTSVEIRPAIAKDVDKVLADPTQIHQIVMNLCTNACHAMEPFGGLLDVKLDQVELAAASLSARQDLKSGRYLRLSIRDTGCGMSPEIISSIFDPYFTTKDLGEGTGLGLAVVHGIVKEYGGEIVVESTPGRGSTFTIYLPAIDAAASKGDLSEQAWMPGGTEHILVVDDEPPILKFMTRILEQHGYRVTAQNDSLQALERFRDAPDAFDLVLSDVTMPKLTGDRLASELLNVRPDIPIILCTGYSRLTSEQTAEKLGVCALISKPLTKKTLLSEIRTAIDEKKPPKMR